MLGSAFWLTLATLLGLCLGFAREWLLVAAWGAGERSDAFLIALFLPEALRMSLAGGVLSAAALPLYLQRKEGERLDWLAVLFPALLLIALVTSLLLTLLAPWLVQLLGPGLAASATSLASSNLQILAWSVPGLMLHALVSIPLQASERFVVAGLGSLLFNLPPVTYLALAGTATQPHSLALACLTGSLLMSLALLPSMVRLGWRPWRLRASTLELRELGGRIGAIRGKFISWRARLTQVTAPSPSKDATSRSIKARPWLAPLLSNSGPMRWPSSRSGAKASCQRHGRQPWRHIDGSNANGSNRLPARQARANE